MQIGDACIFVDKHGTEHNALVIHVWETSVNVVIVDPHNPEGDSFGNQRVKKTSVPFQEPGMSGFYIKR